MAFPAVTQTEFNVNHSIIMAVYNMSTISAINSTSRLTVADNNTVYTEDLNQTVPTYDSFDLMFHHAVYKIIVPILFTLISVIGLAGNLLVAFVIISERVPLTKVNVLLLNLAVSDVIFLLLCVPLMTYHYAADTWNIGHFACSLGYFILYATAFVTVYTMVAVAFIRFLTVVHPETATVILSTTKIRLFILLLWIFFIALTSPIFIFYRVKTVQFGDFTPYSYCALPRSLGRPVMMSFFVLSYALPLTSICAFYLLLLHFLKRQRKLSSLKPTNGSSSRNMRRMKASNILVRVVLGFAICWLPLHVQMLFAWYGTQPQHKLYEIYRILSVVIAYSSSIVNPFVYNFYSKEFRGSFLKLFNRFDKPPKQNSLSFGLQTKIRVSDTKQNITMYSAI